MAFGAAAVASMRVDTLHLILHLLLRVALLTQKQPPCWSGKISNPNPKEGARGRRMRWRQQHSHGEACVHVVVIRGAGVPVTACRSHRR